MMDNPMFKKLMEKKKMEGKMASPMQVKAKSSVLSDLMSELGAMGADKLKGLKKVTVASNSPGGLEDGLAKAKEMLAKQHGMGMHPDEDESMEDPTEEASETPDEEMSEDSSEDSHEYDHESKDELEAQLAEIQAKLAKMKA